MENFFQEFHVGKNILHMKTHVIRHFYQPTHGDPMGTSVVLSVINPNLMQLKSELVARFIDDLTVTLGGPTDITAADIDHTTAREKLKLGEI